MSFQGRLGESFVMEFRDVQQDKVLTSFELPEFSKKGTYYLFNQFKIKHFHYYAEEGVSVIIPSTDDQLIIRDVQL